MGFLFPSAPKPVAPSPQAALAAQAAATQQAAMAQRQASAFASGRSDTESSKTGALGVAESPLGTGKATTLF